MSVEDIISYLRGIEQMNRMAARRMVLEVIPKVRETLEGRKRVIERCLEALDLAEYRLQMVDVKLEEIEKMAKLIEQLVKEI